MKKERKKIAYAKGDNVYVKYEGIETTTCYPYKYDHRFGMRFAQRTGLKKPFDSIALELINSTAEDLFSTYGDKFLDCLEQSFQLTDDLVPKDVLSALNPVNEVIEVVSDVVDEDAVVEDVEEKKRKKKNKIE